MACIRRKNPARLPRCTELAFTRVRGLAITNPDRLGHRLVAERVAWLDCHYGRGGCGGLGRVPDVDGANRRKARGTSRVWLLHPVRRIEHRPRDHGGSERLEHTPSRSPRCCCAASYCPASCSVLPAKPPSTVRSVRWRCRPDAAIGTHWSIQSKASPLSTRLRHSASLCACPTEIGQPHHERCRSDRPDNLQR